MGGCLSSQEYHSTAKLVTEDGSLDEFLGPVKVADILRERAGFFVCHSDSMAFDEYLTPLKAEDELQPDEFYFVLPLPKLKYPLVASEMAALASKAVAALERRRHKSSKKCRRRKVMPLEEDRRDMDRSQIHRLPSADGLGEFVFCKESETFKSRNLSDDSRTIEKLKHNMASRRTMAPRKTLNTKPSPIPEGFAY